MNLSDLESFRENVVTGMYANDLNICLKRDANRRYLPHGWVILKQRMAWSTIGKMQREPRRFLAVFIPSFLFEAMDHKSF